MKTLHTYVLNCFWLLVPILLWNIIFASKLPAEFLPDIFWRDIPPLIKFGENITRVAVFALPAFMPLDMRGRRRETAVYLIGVIIYFISWVLIMAYPNSEWSTSILGFFAPAYTPLIWLVGIGLISQELYFTTRYRSWMYSILSIAFVTFHVTHTALVYVANF